MKHLLNALANLAILVGLLFTACTALSQNGPNGTLQTSGPPQDGPDCSTCTILEEVKQSPPSIEITNVEQVITQPGRYHLAHDLQTNPSMGVQTGIIIATNNVTIDLNGHVMNGTHDNTGINMTGNFTNITVKNGIIDGFYYGVGGAGASGVTVENVHFGHIWGSAVKTADNTRIVGCDVVGVGTATNPAIQLANNGEVAGCHISNWGTAPGAICIATGDHCAVSDDTVGNGNIGIQTGSYCYVARDFVFSNLTTGISPSMGTKVEKCEVDHCGGDGLALMQSCEAVDNTVIGCGLSGVDLMGNDCLVKNNKVDMCNTLNDPMSCGIAGRASSCVIDGNVVSRCKQFGINVYSPYTNNEVIRNITSGNPTLGFNIQAWNFPTNDIAQQGNASSVSIPYANISRP